MFKEKLIPTSEDKEGPEKDKIKNISRRDFLRRAAKGAGIVAGAAALEGTGPLVGEALASLDKEEDIEGLFIYNPDSRPISEALDFNSEGLIELDSKVRKDAKMYWKAKYSDELNKDFKDAYGEMQEYVPDLKKAFMEEGVPEKYLYLAIPESHWKFGKKARSSKGAKGPYQFTTRTALNYGLRIDRKKGIDERENPLKSGRACAKCLKDLYDRTGDWDTALSGYNGGFIWNYVKRGKDLKYKDFTEKHLAGTLNNIKKEIKEEDYFKKEVPKRGGSMRLAENYRVNIRAIEELNGKKESKMKAGDMIKIPLGSKKQRERIYNIEVSGYKQNLDYAPKVNAVLEMIEEGVV